MAVKLNYCADDLLNLKFKKNVKGYDAYHVDSTLDKVISDLRYYENFYKISLHLLYSNNALPNHAF